MRTSPESVFKAYPWGRQAICLAPLALMLVILTTWGGTGNSLTLRFGALRTELPDTTKVLEFLTDWLIPFLYAVWLMFFFRALLRKDTPGIRRFAVFALVQICVAMLLVQLTKSTIGRPRPGPALEGVGFMPWSFDNDTQSFPSGHTAEATGAASPFVVRVNSSLLALLPGLVIALVAFSRLFLSRHHLSDIAGGACVGVAASFLNFYLCTENRHDYFFKQIPRRFRIFARTESGADPR